MEPQGRGQSKDKDKDEDEDEDEDWWFEDPRSIALRGPAPALPMLAHTEPYTHNIEVI